MKLPRRQYIVTYVSGSRTNVSYGSTLQKAIRNAQVPEHGRFSYKVYEGQNQVECVMTKAATGSSPARWRERGKARH